MKKQPAAGARRSGTAAKAEPGLGEVLRQLRTERKLSVRTLAHRAGFSPSFISQVELNQASPSIASLERLAGALGVTLGHLFRDGASAGAPAITRSGTRRRVTSWWSRARIEPLTAPGPGRPFEAVMLTIAPGGSSGKRPHVHPVAQLAIVFDGELRLTLRDEVQALGPGDAVTLDPSAPHLWENAGKVPARLVLVSAPVTR